ncbi:Calx-beta domain protein, partial [Ancylostoma ceylanicum]
LYSYPIFQDSCRHCSRAFRFCTRRRNADFQTRRRRVSSTASPFSTDHFDFKERFYRQEIEIAIVDNDIYEDDEQFMVRLSQVRAHSPSQFTPIPVRLGAASTATVLIVDDDHAGAFGFTSEKFKVVESAGEFVAEVVRTRGARGEVSIPYKTIDGQAKAGDDYEHCEGTLRFSDEQIKLDEGIEGKPVLSLSRCKVVITEDKEFKSFVDRMLTNANTSIMVGTSSWKQQFNEAITVEEDEDGNITTKEKIMHYISLPWKLLFALIPPTDYYNGWLCFVVAIVMIGLLTAVIGDLASHFGCTVGMKDTVTAISLVAMGTSVPG